MLSGLGSALVRGRTCGKPRGWSRGFAAARKLKGSPHLHNSKIWLGMMALGCGTFAVTYYHKEHHDPVVSHPATLLAEKVLNKSRLFTSTTDDGVIKFGGWSAFIETEDPFKAQCRISTMRGIANVTIEAHTVDNDDDNWELDILVLDYPSTLDRFLYDKETGAFYQTNMPAENVTIMDVAAVGYENTYGSWSDMLWGQWSDSSTFRKVIGVAAIALPIAAFTFIQYQKPPRAARAILERVPTNRALMKLLGGDKVELTSKAKANIGKTTGKFTVDVKGTSRQGELRVQIVNTKQRWRVTDARLVVAGSSRAKQIPGLDP